MGDDELRILLTGYLDGELGADDKARIERALSEDPELRAELDQMKGLLEMTEGLSLDERTDTEMEAFWGAVYNKLERHVAWVMLVLGLGIVFLVGLVAFLTTPNLHWGLRAATACAGLGLAGLLWSVWRERRRVLPHDRYTHEVHR